MGKRKIPAVYLCTGDEVEEPKLTGFKALNDVVPVVFCMVARMLARRAIAAADMSALRTAS